MMDQELTDNISKLTAVAVLAVIVVLCSIKLIFIGHIYKKTDNDRFKLVQQELIRLIGGSIIFLMALTAGNPWIYFISFLIGGLLIASEQFMIFLTAVITSDKAKISNIVDSYAKISKMTDAEVDDKVNIDVIEAAQSEIEPDNNEEETGQNTKLLEPVTTKENNAQASTEQREAIATPKSELKHLIRKLRDLAESFEQHVMEEVERKAAYRYNIRTNMKITNKDGSVDSHDIVVLDKESNLVGTIEIKMSGGMNLSHVKKIIEKTVDIERTDAIKRVVVIGFRTYNYDQLQALKDYRDKINTYNNNVGIAYYEISNENGEKPEFKPLYITDLEALVDPLSRLFKANT